MPNLDPKRGRELLIDCRNDQSIVYASAGLDLSPAFTAACWFKLPAGESLAQAPVLSAYNAGLAGNEWALQLQVDGAIDFVVTSVRAQSAASQFAADGLWHFLAGVYDGSEATPADRARLYLDGVELATTPSADFPALWNPTSANTAIGANDAGGAPSNVVVRSALIVPVALTATQLQVVESLLQGRDPSYLQRYLASISAPIGVHVQPSFVGRYGDASSLATACRDLSPNRYAATPTASLSLLPKDKAHLVAGAL